MTKAERSRESMAERYQRLKAAGFCVTCGLEDVSRTDFVACRGCRVARSKQQARRSRRAKAKCNRCGRRRSPHSKSGRCLRCHLLDLNRSGIRDGRGWNKKDRTHAK